MAGVEIVGSKLLEAFQCFYVDSKAYIRIGNEFSEWFFVNVGVRQGCVMTQWMSNMYMNGIVIKVQPRTLGRRAQLVGVGEE